MKHAIVFRAQSLDNCSPDSFEFDGELSSENDERRTLAAKNIFDVAKRGVLFHKSEFVRVLLLREAAVIEVFSNEKDEAGRSAPIVALVDFSVSHVDAEFLVAQLNRFVGKIERTINKSVVTELSNALYDIKKKNKLQKSPWRWAIAIGVSATIVWILAKLLLKM